MAEELVLDSGQGEEIFLLSTVPMPTVDPGTLVHIDVAAFGQLAVNMCTTKFMTRSVEKINWGNFFVTMSTSKV
jgi:hypothetical protein